MGLPGGVWAGTALLLLLLLVASAAGRHSECSCLCCELRGETCERYDFATTLCSTDQCSNAVCERKFVKCRSIAGTVTSACITQDSWIDKTVISVVVLCLVCLFALALLRYRVPLVKQCFPQPPRSERRKPTRELQKAMHRNQELISNLDWTDAPAWPAP